MIDMIHYWYVTHSYMQKRLRSPDFEFLLRKFLRMTGSAIDWHDGSCNAGAAGMSIGFIH